MAKFVGVCLGKMLNESRPDPRAQGFRDLRTLQDLPLQKTRCFLILHFLEKKKTAGISTLSHYWIIFLFLEGSYNF